MQYKTWQHSKSYFVQSWHNAWLWQTDRDTARVPPVRIQTHASHHGGKHSHEVEIKCSVRFLKAVLPLNKCNNWVSEAASHTEQRRYEVRLCLCAVSAACLLRCKTQWRDSSSVLVSVNFLQIKMLVNMHFTMLHFTIFVISDAGKSSFICWACGTVSPVVWQLYVSILKALYSFYKQTHRLSTLSFGIQWNQRPFWSQFGKKILFCGEED